MRGEQETETGEHVQLIMVICMLIPSFLEVDSRPDLKKVRDIDRGRGVAQTTRGNASGRTQPLIFAEKQTLAGTRAQDWERMWMKGDKC